MKYKKKSVKVVLDRLPTEEIGNADQHLMDEDDIQFVSSLDLSKHPMRNVKYKIRIKY